MRFLQALDPEHGWAQLTLCYIAFVLFCSFEKTFGRLCLSYSILYTLPISPKLISTYIWWCRRRLMMIWNDMKANSKLVKAKATHTGIHNMYRSTHTYILQQSLYTHFQHPLIFLLVWCFFNSCILSFTIYLEWMPCHAISTIFQPHLRQIRTWNNR